ncbi:hypothetical protein FI667_g6938, partial [Globisporangium splendens]
MRLEAPTVHGETARRVPRGVLHFSSKCPEIAFAEAPRHKCAGSTAFLTHDPRDECATAALSKVHVDPAVLAYLDRNALRQDPAHPKALPEPKGRRCVQSFFTCGDSSSTKRISIGVPVVSPVRGVSEHPIARTMSLCASTRSAHNRHVGDRQALRRPHVAAALHALHEPHASLAGVARRGRQVRALRKKFADVEIQKVLFVRDNARMMKWGEQKREYDAKVAHIDAQLTKLRKEIEEVATNLATSHATREQLEHDVQCGKSHGTLAQQRQHQHDASSTTTSLITAS